MSAALEVEKRAARWLARRQEPEWSAADQAELDTWLRESTAHEVAYLRLEYGWNKVDRLAVLRPPPVPQREIDTREALEPRESWDTPKPSQSSGQVEMRQSAEPEITRPFLAKGHRYFGRPLAWSAATAALLLSVLMLVSYGDLFTRDVYATGIGGHEVVPLPDGSRIELNTNTRVRADFTQEARSIWLERGEAYFDVAHEPSRPFIVYAGGRRVTVLGTKFSVRLDPDANRIQLAVAEGRVQLEELRPKVPAPPMIATGGDKVIAEGASTRIESRSVETVSTDLSWRQGLLTFDQTTLADAAEEFNRYNRKRLVIEPEAADIRIGGSFEAANIEAFARLLEHGFGLQVVELDGEIRVSE